MSLRDTLRDARSKSKQEKDKWTSVVSEFQMHIAKFNSQLVSRKRELIEIFAAQDNVIDILTSAEEIDELAVWLKYHKQQGAIVKLASNRYTEAQEDYDLMSEAYRIGFYLNRLRQ